MLRLHGEYDDIDTLDVRRLRARADGDGAEARREAEALLRNRLDDPEALGCCAPGEQGADECACHVAAADESDHGSGAVKK